MINTLKLPFLCGRPHERTVRSAPDGQHCVPLHLRMAKWLHVESSWVPGAVGMGGDGWAWSGAGAAGLPLQGWEIWGFHATGEKTGRSASGPKRETTGEFRNWQDVTVNSTILPLLLKSVCDRHLGGDTATPTAVWFRHSICRVSGLSPFTLHWAWAAHGAAGQTWPSHLCWGSGGLEGDHGDPAHGEGRKDSRRCRFQRPPRTILVFFGGFLALGLFFVEFQS